MTKTVVIFGAGGGIGGATARLFADQGYQVIPIGSDYLDFDSTNSHYDVAKLLNQAQPDVVVNSAGVFINGYVNTHHTTMNVNFGSNWSIISYYMALKGLSKTTRVIMVGENTNKKDPKMRIQSELFTNPSNFQANQACNTKQIKVHKPKY